MLDIIIKNGTVIDGTRAPGRRADVGIQGDRIAEVGDLSATEAGLVIDAGGKLVAPGFVDVHTHSDSWLLSSPHFTVKTMQGFTTEFVMADGISYAPVDEYTVHDWLFYLRALNGLRMDEYSGWRSIGDYMALLDRKNAQNTVAQIPYGNLRAIACGFGADIPDDFQMRHIRNLVAQGMSDGAVGISTGMDYIAECFALTDELVNACAVMAEAGGVYITHVRYKLGTLNAIKEAVEIGKRAGVPVHISHMKDTTAEAMEAILKYVDEVAVNEVDFSFDVYPYLFSSTMLNFFLPMEVWVDGAISAMSRLHDRKTRDRFNAFLETTALEDLYIAWLPGRDNAVHQGKSLRQYVDEMGQSPADALCDLLIEERLAVLLTIRFGDDSLIAPMLAHDKYMMGSDGIYYPDGIVHPRVYGSAPRLIGHFARDRKLFSVEDAVYKLSAHPAQRFGMVERGELKPDYFADVVVFDLDAIDDPSTYDDPHQLATGMAQVIVNGVPIIRDGQPLADLPDELPGRYVKFKV